VASDLVGNVFLVVNRETVYDPYVELALSHKLSV